MKRLLLLTFALSFVGCSTTGVVPMDHGVYMIAAKHSEVGFGEPVHAQADAYKEAAAWCAKTNQDVETVRLDKRNSGFAKSGSATLQFRCVDQASSR